MADSVGTSVREAQQEDEAGQAEPAQQTLEITEQLAETSATLSGAPAKMLLRNRPSSAVLKPGGISGTGPSQNVREAQQEDEVDQAEPAQQALEITEQLAETSATLSGAPAKTLLRNRPSSAVLKPGGISGTGPSQRPPRPRSASFGALKSVDKRPASRPTADVDIESETGSQHSSVTTESARLSLRKSVDKLSAPRPAADVDIESETGSQRSSVTMESARLSLRKCHSQSSVASTSLPSGPTSRQSSNEPPKACPLSQRRAPALAQLSACRCETFGETLKAMSSRGGAAQRVNPMTFSNSRKPQGDPSRGSLTRPASLGSVRGGMPLGEAVHAYNIRESRHNRMTFTNKTRTFDDFGHTSRPRTAARAKGMAKNATA